VRDQVPPQYPVSAKMRLGFDDPSVIDENAKRAEQGGANWITIHGRTKTQGYIPPAYWEPIGRVSQSLSIPVIANGEINSIESFRRCREITGCIHFMIGRAALSRPSLTRAIRKEMNLPIHAEGMEFPNTPEPLFWAKTFLEYSKFQPQVNRLKQWARYLHSQKSMDGFDEIKSLDSVEKILNYLSQTPVDPKSSLKAGAPLSQIES
jgi:tRNA-dihydrouridine synthase C